jgi:hypothetical protein
LRRPHPEDPDRWIYKVVGEVQLVPYRLPDVREAVSLKETIFCCEGEKDADRLVGLGLYATTNPMGAEKWRSEYTPHFARARVVILPDNDDAGRRHAEQVAQALHGVAAEVRVLALPDLPEKGDVKIRTKIFRHTYCAARLQTLDHGAPVSVYSVGRELGHGGESLVRRVYGHLGEVRHRSEVMEYRVEQFTKELEDRLARLGT